MTDFLRRVQRLKKKLEISELPAVTLIYSDGAERTMDCTEAFREMCTNKSVVSAISQDAKVQSFFDALGPGFDCAELWEDYKNELME